jgi:hypothetical protein
MDSIHEWMDLVPLLIWNIGGPVTIHVLAPSNGTPTGHLQAPNLVVDTKIRGVPNLFEKALHLTRFTTGMNR